MLSLAFSLIKGHKAGLVGVFVAVLFGSAILTACGILIDSGLRGGFPPERYASASVVVGAPQSLSELGSMSQHYSERVPIPARWVSEISRVPGVRTTVGDVSSSVSLVSGSGQLLVGTSEKPILAHGWSSAVLGSISLSTGTAPAASDEVVLDTALAAQAGIRPGDSIEVVSGSEPSRYRVTGLASAPAGLQQQSAVFLTDAQALRLYGRPGEVDTVGVIADPGVSASALAGRIASALPSSVTYTGVNRAEAEFLDLGQGRSFLVQVAGSLGGTMALVVMLVVVAALGVSIQERRREMALLRAIAATPRQVHQLIGTEVLIVSGVAAAVGTLPGLAVSALLRAAFVGAGTIPAGFTFAVDPLPFVASVAICVAVARIAALFAARRAAKLSVSGAISEAADKPVKVGSVRLTIGYLLIVAGIGGAIAVPLIAPGQIDAIQGSVSGAALVLMVAVALLGPHWLPAIVGLARRLAPRGDDVSAFLSTASMNARARRISLAIIPLVMAVTLAAVELFATTTLVAASQQQARDGLTADYVVTAAGPGLSPRTADTIRGVAGVSAVTPVARTQVLAVYKVQGEFNVESFSAQGITPAGLDSTMNLDVTTGSLAGLAGDTVALSRSAAATIGVSVGQTAQLHLGDGTVVTPRVIAVYDNGLGYGDVTLPNATVIDHTTSRLDADILVRAEPGANAATVGKALDAALAGDPGVAVSGRDAFTAAQAGTLASQSDASLILDGILLAFIMIAVVNSLIMATAARVREFNLLRLIGVTRRQVLGMMRRETGIVVAAAIVIGTLAAVPPLVSVSVGVKGSPLPDVPPLEYLGIVAVVVTVGWISIMVPAGLALRSRPAVTAGPE